MQKTTSVALGNHFESFISTQIRDGRFNSASEVIRASLRLMEEREMRLTALRQALREGENSGRAEYSLENIMTELDAEGTAR